MCDDETQFWLSVPSIQESITQAEKDIAAGRTYGQADIRTELAGADADYATENTVSGHELRRHYGLS
jgi:hypothetical protein